DRDRIPSRRHTQPDEAERGGAQSVYQRRLGKLAQRDAAEALEQSRLDRAVIGPRQRDQRGNRDLRWTLVQRPLAPPRRILRLDRHACGETDERVGVAQMWPREIDRGGIAMTMEGFELAAQRAR